MLLFPTLSLSLHVIGGTLMARTKPFRTRVREPPQAPTNSSRVTKTPILRNRSSLRRDLSFSTLCSPIPRKAFIDTCTHTHLWHDLSFSTRSPKHFRSAKKPFRARAQRAPPLTSKLPPHTRASAFAFLFLSLHVPTSQGRIRGGARVGYSPGPGRANFPEGLP